MQMDLDAQT